MGTRGIDASLEMKSKKGVKLVACKVEKERPDKRTLFNVQQQGQQGRLRSYWRVKEKNGRGSNEWGGGKDPLRAPPSPGARLNFKF